MLFRECCGTVSTTLSLQDSQFPDLKHLSIAQYFAWSSVPVIDAIREYLVEKDTLSFTVMGTFKSNSGEQLNTCWSFISPEYEVENLLSWITKTELMMEVSLVLYYMMDKITYYLNLRSQASKIWKKKNQY